MVHNNEIIGVLVDARKGEGLGPSVIKIEYTILCILLFVQVLLWIIVLRL